MCVSMRVQSVTRCIAERFLIESYYIMQVRKHLHTQAISTEKIKWFGLLSVWVCEVKRHIIKLRST